MLRAMRAEKSVGRAKASSSALVCSDWVWPPAAAMASTMVRETLLNTSCAASDQPEVWQWARRDRDRWSLAPNFATASAHSRRPARILATSMK